MKLSSIKGLSEEDKTNIAKSFGWCQFLFTEDGCKRLPDAEESEFDKKKHYDKYAHPDGYIPGTKCTFNVCNEEVVMPRRPAVIPLHGISSIPRSTIVGIEPSSTIGLKRPRDLVLGGGKSLKKYRKNNKRFTSRRPSTKHHRTKRHTRRRRTKHRRH